MNIFTVSLILVAGLFFFRPVRVAFAAAAGGYMLGMIAILALIPLIVFVTTKSLVIAILVALVGIFLVLSPVFPIPLKSKFFVGVVAISMGIGFAGMLLGQDFLVSLSGYRKAVIGDSARSMNLWEEQYEMYNLPEGTALYQEVGSGKVEFTEKLKVPVNVRLLTEIIEGDNGIKYRRVLFPVVIDGRRLENVFDHRSGFRLVTLSYLGESLANRGGGIPFSMGKLWPTFFFMAGLILVIYLIAKGVSGSKISIPSVIWRTAIVLVVIFLAYGIIAALFHGLGYDLNQAVSSSVESLTAPPPPEIPEHRINLIPGIYPLGQQFQKLELPAVPFKKIVLTEPIRIRAVGPGLIPIQVCAGSERRGMIVKKAPVNYSYYKNMGPCYSDETFLILGKGTIVSFSPGEENIISFSSPQARVVLEQNDPKRPVVFAYREFIE